MYQLKNSERLEIQAKCQFKKRKKQMIDGLLIVTNCAIRFKEQDEEGYAIVYNRLKIKTGECEVATDKDDTATVVRIPVLKNPQQGDPKSDTLNLDFYFTDNNRQSTCENIKKRINNEGGERPEVLMNQCIDQEILLKLDILSQKPFLQDLFQTQVIEKKIYTDDQFWDIHDQFIIDEIGQTTFQFVLSQKLMKNQSSGIQNQPILFIPENGIKSTSPNIFITKEQAQRLIQEYPDLRSTYEHIVPYRMTEEAFWKEFLQQNNKYQTVVFGGNNPIFIPSRTDEKEYEDIYVNENIDGMKKQRHEEIKKIKNENIDINFTANIESFERTNEQGYGTYKKQFESEDVLVFNQLQTDREFFRKKESQKNQANKAAKIISKFNTNSMRIMDSMKNVRSFQKEDIIDEELNRMNQKARQLKEQNDQNGMQVDQIQQEVSQQPQTSADTRTRDDRKEYIQHCRTLFDSINKIVAKNEEQKDENQMSQPQGKQVASAEVTSLSHDPAEFKKNLLKQQNDLNLQRKLQRDTQKPEQQQEWLKSTLDIILPKESHDRRKDQMFQIIEKFRCLVKSFYKTLEQCEMENASDAENFNKLSSLHGQLRSLYEEQKRFQRDVMQEQIENIKVDIRNSSATIPDTARYQKEQEMKVKHELSSIFRANDRVLQVIEIKYKYIQFKKWQNDQSAMICD